MDSLRITLLELTQELGFTEKTLFTLYSEIDDLKRTLINQVERLQRLYWLIFVTKNKIELTENRKPGRLMFRVHEKSLGGKIYIEWFVMDRAYQDKNGRLYEHKYTKTITKTTKGYVLSSLKKYKLADWEYENFLLLETKLKQYRDMYQKLHDLGKNLNSCHKSINNITPVSKSNFNKAELVKEFDLTYDLKLYPDNYPDEVDFLINNKVFVTFFFEIARNIYKDIKVFKYIETIKDLFLVIDLFYFNVLQNEEGITVKVAMDIDNFSAIFSSDNIDVQTIFTLFYENFTSALSLYFEQMRTHKHNGSQVEPAEVFSSCLLSLIFGE